MATPCTACSAEYYCDLIVHCVPNDWKHPRDMPGRLFWWSVFDGIELLRRFSLILSLWHFRVRSRGRRAFGFCLTTSVMWPIVRSDVTRQRSEKIQPAQCRSFTGTLLVKGDKLSTKLTTFKRFFLICICELVFCSILVDRRHNHSIVFRR